LTEGASPPTDGGGVEPNKIGPNPNSSSCLIFISGGVAFPPPSHISYHIIACASDVHIMCTYFLMEEGLSTKDSLGRVHSVFGSPNREERRQQGGLRFKLFPQQFEIDWRSSLFRPNRFLLDFDPPVHRLENRK
jgi:hypothetical protein